MKRRQGSSGQSSPKRLKSVAIVPERSTMRAPESVKRPRNSASREVRRPATQVRRVKESKTSTSRSQPPDSQAEARGGPESSSNPVSPPQEDEKPRTSQPTTPVLSTQVLLLVNSLLGVTLLTKRPGDFETSPGVTVETMRNVPEGLWENHEVRRMLAQVETWRAIFQQMLLQEGLTQTMLELACMTLQTSITNWVELLQDTIKTSGIGNRKGRQAAGLCIRHRVNALTLKARLREFVDSPTEESVKNLYRSMSAMYFLRKPTEDMKRIVVTRKSQ